MISDYEAMNQIAEEMREHPGQTATVRFPAMTASLLVRRHVRAALNDARTRGAEVEALEERGWLESVFSVKMHGTGRQLMPALRVLASLSEEE